jgi:hypothetical protein
MSLSKNKCFTKKVKIDKNGVGYSRIVQEFDSENKWEIAVTHVVLFKTAKVQPNIQTDIPLIIQCSHSSFLNNKLLDVQKQAWNNLAVFETAYHIHERLFKVVTFLPPNYLPFDTSVGDRVEFVLRRSSDLKIDDSNRFEIKVFIQVRQQLQNNGC